jgi:FdhD protein
MSTAEVRALLVAPAARSLVPTAGSPILSCASTELLHEVEIVDERGGVHAIHIPSEKPLTIWFDGRELVTLMTLGGAPEWLVLGYLLNQRLLTDITALKSVRVDWVTASARVQSRDGIAALVPDRAVGGSACALGSVFGDLMRSGESIELPDVSAARISRSELLSILESMRVHDDIHRAAGSVHSCAVFRNSELWAAVEDVSRHNGVDTITGWMALHGVSGADKILFTTGRLTGEMVMKAALNGIPILVTRNGVTSMGRDLALRFGMTLLGRAANRRFLCYSGIQRFDSVS